MVANSGCIDPRKGVLLIEEDVNYTGQVAATRVPTAEIIPVT
jgi:hypothetical protein